MNMTTATNTATASALLLTHTPKAELSNPVKATRTRTTKREIGIGYNVKERQARLVSVTKSILKMVEKGEQITVPTLQARLKLALRPQFLSGAIKVETFAADLNSALKALGITKTDKVVETGKRGRKPVIYAFNADALTAKGQEITKAIAEENEKAAERAAAKVAAKIAKAAAKK
jgi:hypothetical protein